MEEKKGFPEKGLTGCECGPMMQKAIGEQAEKLGLSVALEVKRGEGQKGVYWTGGMVNWWNGGGCGKYVTPSEFLRLMEEEATKPKPIVISGHAIQFLTGEIKVGCTTIPNSVVLEVASRLAPVVEAPAKDDSDDLFNFDL